MSSLLLILAAVGLLVAGVLSGSNLLIVLTIVIVVLAAIVLVIGVRQSGVLRALDDETSQYRQVPRGRGGRFGAAGGGLRRGRTSSKVASATAPVGSGAPEPGETAEYAAAAGDDGGRGPETAVLDVPTAEVPAEALASNGRRAGVRVPPGDPSVPGRNAPARNVPAQAGVPSRSIPNVAGGPDGLMRADVPGAARIGPPIEETQYDEDPPDEPSTQLTPPADAARIATLSTEVMVVDGRPRYHLRDCVHLHARRTEPLPVSEAIELGFTPCGLCEPDSVLLAEASAV